MNSRIKEIRKALNISQADFGKALGVTAAAISRIESGERGITEQMTLSISREFNVNEKWLRTGEGEIFNHLPEGTELGIYIGKVLQSDDDFIRKIIINYMQLDDDSKKIIRDFVESLGSQDT